MDTNCSVEDCDKPVMIAKRQLCKTHYRALVYRSESLKDPRCVIEECNNPIRYTQSGLCNMHYQRKRRTGTTDVPTHYEGPCSFEGCPNPSMKKFPLCTSHRQQQARGGELTPLGSTHRGGSNKVTELCAHTGCDRTSNTKGQGLCWQHHWQWDKHGETWDFGTKHHRKEVGKTYTSERTCERCGATKAWQRFVLGTDHMKDVCRDCNRAALSKEATEPLVPHHSTRPNKNMEDLLDFLRNRTE